MFRSKEYKPIGKKDESLENDPKFVNKTFDNLYSEINNITKLKNELWNGIHQGKKIN